MNDQIRYVLWSDQIGCFFVGLEPSSIQISRRSDEAKVWKRKCKANNMLWELERRNFNFVLREIPAHL